MPIKIMKIIILDTNFLTIPFQFGLDIFKEIDELIGEEHETATIDQVV
ncbi:MAG: nucleotide-binding protein, partial [Candidatus Aenigmarchaeota archaeon]|nr:nucleotide-binding protein [Candidatus Aenigmarchaeota archaeon]